MKTIFASLLFLVALPVAVDAASIHANSTSAYRTGEVIPVEIFLDTEGQNINALEATLELSSGLSVSDIRYGGSVVSFWLEEPTGGTGSVISFSGVIPGGYQGSPERTGKGNLFTLYLKTSASGTERVSFRDSVAYLNDGEGTVVNLSKGPADINVTDEGSASVSTPLDGYPPEAFVPEVVSGELYGIAGDVLVFATQDKDSGVERYEVGFSYFGYLSEFLVSYVSAQSPLELLDGTRGKYIFVRAIDREGNERVARVAPKEPGLAQFITWGVPALILVVLLFVGMWLIRRKISLR